MPGGVGAGLRGDPRVGHPRIWFSFRQLKGPICGACVLPPFSSFKRSTDASLRTLLSHEPVVLSLAGAGRGGGLSSSPSRESLLVGASVVSVVPKALGTRGQAVLKAARRQRKKKEDHPKQLTLLSPTVVFFVFEGGAKKSRQMRWSFIIGADRLHPVGRHAPHSSTIAGFSYPVADAGGGAGAGAYLPGALVPEYLALPCVHPSARADVLLPAEPLVKVSCGLRRPTLTPRWRCFGK